MDGFARRAKGFLHSRVKSVRMAVTKASEIELLVEELTSNEEELRPPTSDLAKLAAAAVYTDEANKIMAVLQQRLDQGGKGGGKYWRMLYKTLTTVEYLLTHGPRHFAPLFAERCIDITEEHCTFKYMDERGTDRGLNVRLKAQQVCELLRDGELLNSERRKAERLAAEITGFGAIPIRKQAFGASKSAGNYEEEVSSSYYSEAHSPMYSDWREEGIDSLRAGAAHGKPAAPAAKGRDAFGAARSQTLPEANGGAADTWQPFGPDAETTTRRGRGAWWPRKEMPKSGLSAISLGVATPASSRVEPLSPAPPAALPALPKALSPSAGAGTPTSVLADPMQEWHTFDDSPPTPPPLPPASASPAPENARRQEAGGSSIGARGDAGGTRAPSSGLKIKLLSPTSSLSPRAATPPSHLSPPPPPQTHVSPLQAPAAFPPAAPVPDLIDL